MFGVSVCFVGSFFFLLGPGVAFSPSMCCEGRRKKQDVSVLVQELTLPPPDDRLKARKGLVCFVVWGFGALWSSVVLPLHRAQGRLPAVPCGRWDIMPCCLMGGAQENPISFLEHVRKEKMTRSSKY